MARYADPVFMSLRLSALTCLAAVAFGGHAHAEPRLDVTATTCETGAVEVERRLASLLATRRSGLGASVAFEVAGDGVRVRVAASENFVARGETVLVVPNCEEAVDAAVVVLALALSKEASGDPVDDSAEPAPEARSLAESHRVAESDIAVRLIAPPARRDESPTSDTPSMASDSAQLSLAGGVDAGTLPTPAVFLAGGVAYSWSHIEMRSSLRYGLLTEDERVETGFSESVQRDFGAVGLSVCYGVGANFRFSACGGGELGVVRVGRRIEMDGAPTSDQDGLSPRMSGVLGALFSARRGRLRPELEVSGAVLALGRREGASPVALRAAAGAAVDF